MVWSVVLIVVVYLLDKWRGRLNMTDAGWDGRSLDAGCFFFFSVCVGPVFLSWEAHLVKGLLRLSCVASGRVVRVCVCVQSECKRVL